MNSTEIISAVRKACSTIQNNATDSKVALALQILGVDKENAINHGLAHYNTRSISKSVKSYFLRNTGK